jgi:hypothetical protein
MQRSTATKRACVLLGAALSFLVSIHIDSAHAQNPNITGGSTDLYPASGMVLYGTNFGTTSGKIHIRFNPDSQVKFEHSSSKDELTMDPASWSPEAISTGEIIQTSNIGAVSKQRVDITVTNEHGVSNVWHATFHDTPYITGGPHTITPKQRFNLSGWNFAEAGTLKVHFRYKSAVEFSHDNYTELDVPIPSPTDDWKPDAIHVKLPEEVTGVIEQQVEIIFTTKNGLKSNAWNTTFVPTLELSNLPSQYVYVVTCGNDGEENQCNNVFSSTLATAFCSIDPSGGVGDIVGFHVGCFGTSVDLGTDVFSANVKYPWKVAYVDVPFLVVDNGNISQSNVIAPGAAVSSVTVSLPWEIGATGGHVDYSGNIVIKGPKGVPYQ